MEGKSPQGGGVSKNEGKPHENERIFHAGQGRPPLLVAPLKQQIVFASSKHDDEKKCISAPQPFLFTLMFKC